VIFDNLRPTGLLPLQEALALQIANAPKPLLGLVHRKSLESQ